ncbi:hypothetical protein MASR1M31_18890 [Porphyromonadaceae bacterium]
MNAKERLNASLNHKQPDRLVVDFGATAVTGIHCKIVAELRRYYGLEECPVKVVEPFQMLGEVDDELQQIIGIDCVPLFGMKNMFSSTQTEYHEQQTWWGQTIQISKQVNMTPARWKGRCGMYSRKEIHHFPPSPLCLKDVTLMRLRGKEVTIILNC